jgi:Fe-S cluster assembly protein SufD
MNGLLEQAKAAPPVKLPWLSELKLQATEQLSVEPLPDRKQEAWRYTSTDKLLQQDFLPSAPAVKPVDWEELEGWFTTGLDAYRLVFVNGYCQPGHDQAKGLPSGVHIGSLRSALNTDEQIIRRYLGSLANPTADGASSTLKNSRVFDLLNQVNISDGLFIHLEPGVSLDKPLEVVYLQIAGQHALVSQPRGLIIMEEGSSAILVERYVSADGNPGFCNSETEILLQQQARLAHYRIQSEGKQASHRGGLYLSQGGKSDYSGSLFSLGGAWSRSDVTVSYEGEEATTVLQGVLLAGNQQTNDVHLDIRHNHPACLSEENFRGLLHGAGKVVFDGRILVAEGAHKTEAHLTNNNLMLTRSAEVNTKPQLEIYNDDVKCSHGTTVGEIDEQQIFYLRSRGIDETRARTLLSLGFVAEIVQQIELEVLRDSLLADIEQRLDKVLLPAA